MRQSKKRKVTKLTKLKAQLSALQAALDGVGTEEKKSNLANRIIETKLLIDVEKTHRQSKFYQVRCYEVLSRAPGLGKRK